jgi:hypothetical protein
MDKTRVKQRSPSYPAVDLGGAIENAKQLWATAQRRRVSQEDAVHAWRYNSLSGPARSRIAALRQYGLIDVDRDGDIGLTRRGQLLAYAPDASSPEYKAALREAALDPPIFRELYDTKPTASNDALQRYLVLERKFSQDGAKRLVEAYRSSIALAKLDSDGYDEDTIEMLPRSGTERDLLPIEAGGSERAREERSPAPESIISEQHLLPIPPDITVEIVFRGAKPSSQDIEMLEGYLMHYKKRLEKLEQRTPGELLLTQPNDALPASISGAEQEGRDSADE